MAAEDHGDTLQGIDVPPDPLRQRTRELIEDGGDLSDVAVPPAPSPVGQCNDLLEDDLDLRDILIPPSPPALPADDPRHPRHLLLNPPNQQWPLRGVFPPEALAMQRSSERVKQWSLLERCIHAAGGRSLPENTLKAQLCWVFFPAVVPVARGQPDIDPPRPEALCRDELIYAAAFSYQGRYDEAVGRRGILLAQQL